MVEVIMNLERLGSQYDPYNDQSRRNVCEQWGKAGRRAIQPGYYVFRQQAKGKWGWTFIAPLNQDCRHVRIKYDIILATYKRQLFKCYSWRI